MRLLIVLTCFLEGCLAKPHPCESPQRLNGTLTVFTPIEELWIYSKFLYDALGQRVRLMEFVSYKNESFTYDFLFNYKEGIAYEISYHNRTCKKTPFKEPFQPMGIPKDATLVGQFVIGSSSGPGEGLLVNSWTGDIPKGGKYLFTFTEFDCIPVSMAYHTDPHGWLVTSFFDNVIGISDPSQLEPPDFCSKAEMNSKLEPTGFLSLFLKKNLRPHFINVSKF